jgi:Hypoxia induced protein conserved region
MFRDPLFLLVAAAVIGVLVILSVGIGSFAKGGEFHKRNANRLMRWRIYAQLGAVVIILIVVWIRRG